MASRNLARSAVENSVNYTYAYARRQENSANRRRVKMLICERLKSADNDVDPPTRKPVKSYRDRYSPLVLRFLASHCGRPWSKVKSMLRRRFDVRNGRDWNLLQIVNYSVRSIKHPYPGSFVVDDEGILQDNRDYSFKTFRA